ncbi:hypothetical protein ACOMHN_036783 [Nucella lapillus]
MTRREGMADGGYREMTRREGMAGGGYREMTRREGMAGGGYREMTRREGMAGGGYREMTRREGMAGGGYREMTRREGMAGASAIPLSRQQFAEAVASIDSDFFAPTAFKSSCSSKPLKETKELPELSSHSLAMFGAVGNSVVFTKSEPLDKNSVPLENNPDTLFDSSLNVDPEEIMRRWIQKLTIMRRKRLEGEVIHSY